MKANIPKKKHVVLVLAHDTSSSIAKRRVKVEKEIRKNIKAK
jgi:hypothetical protein